MATEPNPPSHPEEELPRRDFIRKTAATGLGAAALGGAAAMGNAAHAAPAAKQKVEFQPEEVWRDRMKAPADRKKYGWLVDTRRCFGCHGCEVACKAENDVPLGHYIRQTIYHDFERPTATTGQKQIARIMVPMACQHCEDAPCLKACPCGALHKGAGGTVQINYDSCSGHAACKDACPYGAIYIDPVANQAVKCHNCTHRVDVGMDPACVATCPSDALFFGDLNDPESKISRMQAKLNAEGKLETLRPEEKTKPRMQFVVDDRHPVDAWEKKIPRQGESYSPDAYDIYNWGEEEGGQS